MKLELSRQIYKKKPNIKFYENPSNGSRAVPWKRMDRRTDMTKLIVALSNFANAPKIMKTVSVHRIYSACPPLWPIHKWRRIQSAVTRRCQTWQNCTRRTWTRENVWQSEMSPRRPSPSTDSRDKKTTPWNRSSSPASSQVLDNPIRSTENCGLQTMIVAD